MTIAPRPPSTPPWSPRPARGRLAPLARRLSTGLRKGLRYFRFPRDIRLLREQIAQVSRELMIATDPRYADPRHLCRATGRVYSQNGEDGILAAIFARVGTTNRTFVEVGAGAGVENNTRLLLEAGWRGLWIDYGDENERAARRAFAGPVAEGRLTVVNARVDAGNVEALLAAAGVPPVVDLLSIDVDANTHHVWRALRAVAARVAVIEYNASYPPSVSFELPYDPDAQWDGSNRYGASLKALERIGADKGMALVGCDWNGVNAFFVARAEVGERFAGPFTAEAQYEPPRHSFEAVSGHARFDPP